MITEKQVLEALSRVMDPELNRSLTELNMVRDLKISPEGDIKFSLILTIPTCPLRDKISQDAQEALQQVQGVRNVTIEFGAMTPEEREKIMLGDGMPLPKLTSLNRIRQVVAVMSGKGGVGKSSITALLASALARQGKKVGILDADITGPSIPRLFGLPSGGIRGSEQGMLPAVSAGGIKIMSSNLLLDDETKPVIWRGPMISGVIKQFWEETLWGNLDYLLTDLPPGTSDAALTVAQSLPLNGVILVTTPQALSTMVVMKALGMIQALQTPLLGIVENMSSYVCPECHTVHAIFGSSHAQKIADSAGSEVLARLPVNSDMTQLCDDGRVEQVQLAEMDALALKVDEKMSAADRKQTS